MTYIEPVLPILVLIGFIGLRAAWRSSTPGRRPWLETFSLCAIFFFSLESAAWVLSRPLEMWYPDGPVQRQGAGAIVVLSGNILPPTPGRPYALAGPDTYRRVQYGLWLFRSVARLPILVSGHADTMRRILESEGVPADMIWTENRSTNTHENAVYGADLLRAHGVSRILLVVEATSMPRAAGAFRKAGIAVMPAPAWRNHLTTNFNDYLPGWHGLQQNGAVIHEMIGLVWYKGHGWI